MYALDVLRHGIDRLDPRVLQQIASHLEHITDLACSCAQGEGTAFDLVRTKEWDTARQLAAYCRAAHQLREDHRAPTA